MRNRTSTAEQGHNVRFGSLADICSAKRHVRFTPDSDRKSRLAQMSALASKADVCGANCQVCFGPKETSQVYSITSSIRASSRRHTSVRCPHRTARPTVRRSMHSIDSGARRKQSLWTIRSSEQSCTDSSFEFEETGWFETSKPSAQCFNFKNIC